LAAERRNYEAAVKGRQDFRKAYRDMAEQVRTVLEGVDFDDLTTYIDKLKADLAAERERAEKAEANLAEMRERVRAAHDRYAADAEPTEGEHTEESGDE
ncbi:MAG: hypothetical protein VW362_12940, partial [Candidatus Nanopelagicales bacterium]